MIKQIFAACVLVICSFSLQAGSSIDINTADASTISQQLVGVGDAKAQAIVEYREQHGPFTSVEDLAKVTGIGDKTLDKIRTQVYVSSENKD